MMFKEEILYSDQERSDAMAQALSGQGLLRACQLSSACGRTPG